MEGGKASQWLWASKPKIADGFGDPSSRPTQQKPALWLPGLHHALEGADQSPTGSSHGRDMTLSCIYIPVCALVFKCPMGVLMRQLIQFLQRNWLMDWIKRSPLCPQRWPGIPILHSLLVFSFPPHFDKTLDNTRLGACSGEKREARKEEKSQIRAGAHLYI